MAEENTQAEVNTPAENTQAVENAPVENQQTNEETLTDKIEQVDNSDNSANETLTDKEKTQEQEVKETKVDPEDTVPEGEYKFYNEDGTEVSAEDAAGFQSAFKEANLTSRQAKQLKAAYDKEMTKIRDQIANQARVLGNEWLSEVRADRELGGENITATKKNIGEAIDAFGNDALREFFKSSRLGNHPEMVRFLNNVGKAVSQDRFINGNGASRTETPSDRARRLYPNSPDLWNVGNK